VFPGCEPDDVSPFISKFPTFLSMGVAGKTLHNYLVKQFFAQLFLEELIFLKLRHGMGENFSDTVIELDDGKIYRKARSI
jgi:hypothetical protein